MPQPIFRWVVSVAMQPIAFYRHGRCWKLPAALGKPTARINPLRVFSPLTVVYRVRCRRAAVLRPNSWAVVTAIHDLGCVCCLASKGSRSSIDEPEHCMLRLEGERAILAALSDLSNCTASVLSWDGLVIRSTPFQDAPIGVRRQGPRREQSRRGFSLVGLEVKHPDFWSS